MSIGHLIYTARLIVNVCVMRMSVHIYDNVYKCGKDMCDCLCIHGCIDTFLTNITEVLCVCMCVTCDNGGHAPADGIVEPHGTIVDVALFGLHAVDMKALHEHPGKCGHEEVM